MTNLAVAFRNFANATKNYQHLTFLLHELAGVEIHLLSYCVTQFLLHSVTTFRSFATRMTQLKIGIFELLV
jgi:hypothetical protein